MTDSDSSDLFEHFQHQLASAHANMQASEVHGVICGLLTAGQSSTADLIDEIFDQHEEGDLLVQDCQRLINNLFETTAEEMNGPGLGISLLLPDENRPIKERAQALSLWCQGFLYGLGSGEKNIEQYLGEESKEAMQDISELTRLDYENLEETDEEEDALTEISEFLWVAAMLIRENIYASKEEANSDHDKYH